MTFLKWVFYSVLACAVLALAAGGIGFILVVGAALVAVLAVAAIVFLVAGVIKACVEGPAKLPADKQ